MNDEIGTSFGTYLKKVREGKNIKIRQLAKNVGKTPTYLSDIENGNNKPPGKDLLEKIICALDIEQYPDVKTNLYDLAAKERNDVPADIKEYIMKNRMLQNLIRSTKNMPDAEQVWARLLTEL